MMIFSSSIIYIGTILVTIIIAFGFRNLIIDAKKKITVSGKIIILIIIAIITMPLIVLSGMRGDSVGVDTYNYLITFELAGEYTNFWTFFKSRGKEDFLYCLFTYIIKNITNSRFLYLGGLQFLALAPIVKIAIDESDEVPLWKMIFIYTCWYFTDSLNAMRQYIAVAFLLTMYQKFVSKKYKQGIISLLIAYGFHSSVILIGPILIIIQYIFDTKVILKIKYVILMLCFWIISFGQNIIIYIFNSGFVPGRWKFYINTFIFQNSRMTEHWRILSNGNYFELIVRGIVLISCVFLCSNLKYKKREMNEYEYIYILNILIYAIGIIVYHTGYAVRVSVYFDAFIIYLFPILDEKFFLKIKIGNMKIPFFSVIVSVIYCFIHSILIGSGGAIPYVTY